METIGYDGEASTGEASHVYLELHVDQELVLDADDVQIGIVGMSWADVCITGQSIQAGPPPMHMRNDLMTAARDAAHVINKRPQS